VTRRDPTREILFRRASLDPRPEPPWHFVGSAPDLPRAIDEVASWLGPRPAHGDAVLLHQKARPQRGRAFVFDEDSGLFTTETHAYTLGEGIREWEQGHTQRMVLRGSLGTLGRRTLVYRYMLLACEATERMAAGVRATLTREDLPPWVDGLVLTIRSVAAAIRAGSPEGVVSTHSYPLRAEWSKALADLHNSTRELESWARRDLASSEPLRGSFRDAVRILGRAAYVLLGEEREMLWRHVPLASYLCALANIRDPFPLHVYDPARTP